LDSTYSSNDPHMDGVWAGYQYGTPIPKLYATYRHSVAHCPTKPDL